MMGENIAPKHVQLTRNYKLTYTVHLVGYFHNCITMHGFISSGYCCISFGIAVFHLGIVVFDLGLLYFIWVDLVLSVLICTMVVLYCFGMCGCVCMWVWVCVVGVWV
jgi:hypothetical protein